MPETRKEPRTCPENRTCHDCGLEDYDACESSTPSRHLPDDENRQPCIFCVRNAKKPKQRFVADFYCEMWTRSGDKDYTPEISDPDPDEQELLRVLHSFVNAQEVR